MLGWSHFAISPGMLRFVCIKYNAVSKASTNFSSEEYRQRFRIKLSGIVFRLAPPHGGLLVSFTVEADSRWISATNRWLPRML